MIMRAKNRITVHTLVKNEERWIWYALKSVLPFVDQIIVWDTGSTDKTTAIIRATEFDRAYNGQLRRLMAGHSYLPANEECLPEIFEGPKQEYEDEQDTD